MTLSKFRENFQDDVQDQIARLNREVTSLRKALSRRGSTALADTRDSAADLYEDLWERMSNSLPDIRRGARRARDTARDNPVATTAVTIGVIGLLVALMSRRSS